MEARRNAVCASPTKSVAESGRLKYRRLIIVGQETLMVYNTPTLKRFGTLSSLTLGQGGSCPDGNTNVTQMGGMSECGTSG